MRWSTLPLAYKILALTLPLTLGPTLLVGVPAYWYLRQTFLLAAAAGQEAAAIDAAQGIRRTYDDLVAVAGHLAAMDEIRTLAATALPGDRERGEARLAVERLMALEITIGTVRIFRAGDPDPFLEIKRQPHNANARPAVGAERTLGEPAVSPGTAGSRPIVATSAVRVRGCPMGTVTLEANQGTFRNILEAAALRHGGGYALFDERGAVLRATGATTELHERIGAGVRSALTDVDGGAPIGLAVEDGLLISVRSSASELADGGRWLLWTRSNDAQTRAQLNQLFRVAVMVLSLAVILSLTGAGFMAGSLVRPLAALARSTERVAKGDFDVQVAETRGDEIGGLTKAFNAMASSLARYRQDLIRAEGFAALGRLASMVAHEVRNPLNAIRGCVDYLRLKRPDDELLAHHAEIIRLEIDGLNTFVRDFLGLARLPAPKREPIDLGELLGTHLDLHRAETAAQGVDIDLAFASTVAPVSLDAHQIRSVFENLTTNALEAMTSPGTLRVSIQRQGDEALVSFADTGPGMPPEVARQLFTPFFTTKDEGNGIGLATARRIVEAHGGTLDFTTRLGEGTCFVVRLPIQHGSTVPAR